MDNYELMLLKGIANDLELIYSKGILDVFSVKDIDTITNGINARIDILKRVDYDMWSWLTYECKNYNEERLYINGIISMNS